MSLVTSLPFFPQGSGLLHGPLAKRGCRICFPFFPESCSLRATVSQKRFSLLQHDTAFCLTFLTLHHRVVLAGPYITLISPSSRDTRSTETSFCLSLMAHAFSPPLSSDPDVPSTKDFFPTAADPSAPFRFLTSLFFCLRRSRALLETFLLKVVIHSWEGLFSLLSFFLRTFCMPLFLTLWFFELCMRQLRAYVSDLYVIVGL